MSVSPSPAPQRLISQAELLAILERPNGFEQRLACVNGPRAEMLLDSPWQLFPEGEHEQVFGAKPALAQKQLEDIKGTRIALKPKASAFWATGEIDLPATTTSLVLRGNGILDLARLKELPALRYLYLEKTKKIESLDALSEVPELRVLICHDTKKIKNADVLGQLPKLELLELTGTGITDIAPLAKLPLLKALYLPPKLKDLKVIAQMKGLMHLHGWINQVKDISPIAELANLRVLSLAFGKKVKDLSPIGRLTQLESLDLGYMYDAGAGPTDFSWLASLTGLRRLSLSCCPFPDLSAMAGMKSLEYLAFGDTPLKMTASTFHLCTIIPVCAPSRCGADTSFRNGRKISRRSSVETRSI